MARSDTRIVQVAGREVSVSNPDKIFFPTLGKTKLDVVEYYLAVAEGALRGIRGRPMILKRFVDGAEAEPFYQKRAPASRPDWLRTVTITFPSGRTADEVVVDDAAGLIWVVNLGCIDLNPWAVRADDVDHPDELRVDLDPTPETPFDHVRQVAMAVRDVLEENGLRGFPKTSGSRGIHVNVRIEPHWGFQEVRRAALALGREIERRLPALATTAWWKEERHGVFIDYNQNARDRTVASAYSIRPKVDARVSCPLRWEEVPTVEPADFTLDTVPARFRAEGDPGAAIDLHVGSLDGLLALSRAQEADGLGDAPWPPHFAKGSDEPPRVAPSRRRTPAREPSRGRERKSGAAPPVSPE